MKFFDCSAVLGNHDYRGDVEAQLSPVLSNLDNRWFCSRSYIVNAGENNFDFFFILIINFNL
jgi:hypothetical protein